MRLVDIANVNDVKKRRENDRKGPTLWEKSIQSEISGGEGVRVSVENVWWSVKLKKTAVLECSIAGNISISPVPREKLNVRCNIEKRNE